MSTGKAASQAAHAAFRQSKTGFKVYENHYKVIVLEAPCDLLTLQDYLLTQGYFSELVIDEGRTENTRYVPTALACGPLDGDHPVVSLVFGGFKTFRDNWLIRLIRRLTPMRLSSLTKR